MLSLRKFYMKILQMSFNMLYYEGNRRIFMGVKLLMKKKVFCINKMRYQRKFILP